MTILAWNRTDYDRERYQRAKRRLVELLGGECVICGRADELEFDHIDPATKKFAIMSRWNRSVDYLLPELVKCQLLCAECHQSKSDTAASVNHGAGSSGKRNCSCELCRIRKNVYMRDWKKRHRAA